VSYQTLEASAQDASPIELYEFRRGGDVWRYSSGSSQETHIGYVYQPLPLRRSNIEQAGEMGRAGLRVSLPRDAQVAQGFVAAPPAEVTTLTIYRRHRGSTETVTLWMGRVLNAQWRDAEVEFSCEPVYTSLQRVGLRRLYQRNCTHVLYGSACGVSAVAYRVSGTVTVVNGNALEVPAAASYSAGHFAGGYLTWVSGSITEKRMITAHSGAAVTLSSVPQSLAAGMAVQLYPGCDHTLTACSAKFANAANFGGFPFMPARNPFATAIY